MIIITKLASETLNGLALVVLAVDIGPKKEQAIEKVARRLACGCTF